MTRTASLVDLAHRAEHLRAWLTEHVGLREVSIADMTMPASAGYSNETLIFTGSWVDGDGRHVQRLVAQAEPPTWQLLPDRDVITRQCRPQQLLATTDVPVARVRWVDAEGEALGRPLYVMDAVDGRGVSDEPVYTAEGWLLDLPPLERRALFHQSIDVLARIHQVDWDARGLSYLDMPEHGRRGCEQLRNRTLHWYRWAVPGGHRVLDDTWRWLDAHWPQSDDVALCWGDARPANLLYDERGVAAVVDWEMVTLADPQLDLGWWLYFQHFQTEAVGIALPEGFLTAEETVDRWSASTGRSAPDLEFYQVLAGFRLALILARIMTLYREAGLLPADDHQHIDNAVSRDLARRLHLPPPGPTLATGKMPTIDTSRTH